MKARCSHGCEPTVYQWLLNALTTALSLQARFFLAKNANLKNISSFTDSPQSILGEPENVSMSSIVINVKDLFERENSDGDSFHDL